MSSGKMRKSFEARRGKIPLTPKKYFAIIDIGSNSVRLVTYSGVKRVPQVVFNEKVQCGLGAEIGTTGRLSEEAMALTMSTLKRFCALCEHGGIKTIYPVATAAMRDASNGQDFAKEIEQETGLQINIIDGKEEGRLSALGVISAEGKAYGMMGDLGGGSLELTLIKGRKAGECISLPIGPLRLQAEFGSDFRAMKNYLRKVFSELELVQKLKHQNFYMVGGAWRNIMQMMIMERSLPLPILQGFRTNAKNMDDYAKRIVNSRPSDLPFGHIISGRRQDIIPIAALILREVLRAFDIKDCKACAYGLREGLVYDMLPDAVKSKDPFLATCKELARERSRFAEHSRLLFDWTSNLFHGGRYDRSEWEERLHLAICYLSDIAWRGHPDFRAIKAVEQILHGNFISLSHEERAYVAIAMNEAYGAAINIPPIRDVLHILPMKDILKARVLGAGLRLAHRLSGGTAQILHESAIEITKKKITLKILSGQEELANRVVHKRLIRLAGLMGKNSAVDTLNRPNQ